MLKNFIAHKVFCIGIGGIGVSGLAELLHQEGITVSGSDPSKNDATKHLQSIGVTVFDSHQAKNIDGAELVVYSSAVKADNPERLAAYAANIPTITRGQLLAMISSSYCSIIVAGTHGKTTTSGVLSWLFEQAKQDPTFMVGGVLRDRHSPMRLGKSHFFIAESDESDASFLFLSPTVAVITNINQDHMETYGHDFEKLKNSFLQFVSKIPVHGFVVACMDNPVLCELIPKIKARVITYGEHPAADCQLQSFHQQGLQSEIAVKFPSGDVETIQLNLAGKHNALNAMAAMIVAREFELPNDAVRHALITFPGMGRRLHPHGEMKIKGGNALVFDDYGHHPMEVHVTMQAVKAAYPDRRLVLVFQPHRYSRTRDLMNDFVCVLQSVDQLVLTEVYAASEQKIPGADGQALFDAVKQAGLHHAEFVPQLSDLPDALKRIVKPNDVVVLQGAGNIVTIADKVSS